MSTLTKEWLLKTIAELEEERDAIPGAVNEDAAMALEAMKLALESLTAEPVAWIVHARSGDQLTADGGYVANAEGMGGIGSTPLYRSAPPAPVSVPDERYQHLSELYHSQEKRLFKLAQRIKGPSFDKYSHTPSQAIDVLEAAVFGESDAACCAAMLQGSEPVEKECRLPNEFDFEHFNDPVWFEAIIGLDNMYDPVTRTLATVALELNRKLDKPELTVWYGSMPETNGKTNWTAILHRKGEGRCLDGFTIDCSEYPGRVLYAADRVRYLIGEKAERPSIIDYDGDAHSGYVKPGNSPAIPEGYALVPVEPTKEMIDAGWSYYMTTKSPSSIGVYGAMLAAAPQHEVK